MKKWMFVLAAMLAAALISGCDGVFDEDYLAVSPHDEQYAVDEGSDALTAENYLGLKNAILSFVENHTDYGVIRIYHYDGEVESDLADAAYEVAKADPLGAYAVDYMTHDCTLIVSYYEIHIYITFARTQEEIDAVQRVGSVVALREAFEGALRRGDESIALRMTSYSEQDLPALARSIYEKSPYDFVELPEVSVELFPSTGVQRIIRITFHYDRTADERETGLSAMLSARQTLTAGISSFVGESRRFEELTGRLLTALDGAELDESAILYDTLCCGRVNAESLSLALRLLCADAGLACQTVEGRRNNLAYTWNIVTLSGVNYHVDLLRDQASGQTRAALYSDDDFADEYSWDRDAYPACGRTEAPYAGYEEPTGEPEPPADAAPEEPQPAEPEPEPDPSAEAPDEPEPEKEN